MPQSLERVERMPRCLPRIVAFNENHDEQGRFAEGDGGGSGGAKSPADHVNDLHEKAGSLARQISTTKGKDRDTAKAEAKALEETARAAIDKMSKKDLVEAVQKMIRVDLSSKPLTDIKKVATKAIIDRIGTALRQNI